MLSSPRPTELGFTLIELVVGMILAVLVLGAAMLAMTSMFGGASEQSVDRTAAAKAADVLEQFQRDVTAAESPERLNEPMVRDEMRAIVLWGVSKGAGGTVSAITASNPCNTPSERAKDYCRFQDVTVARADQIWFRADVDTTHNGHECVSWVITGGGLTRTVSSDHLRCYLGDRGGSTLSSEQLLQAPASAAVGNFQGRSASFGFLTRYNANSDGPAKYNTIVDATDCSSQMRYTGADDLTVNLNGMERGFITNVTLDLSAWATGGESTGTAASSARQKLTSSATIASRSNDDYAYATGCAQ